VFFWCIVFASYILYVFFRKKTVSNSAGAVDELVAVSSDTSQVRESRAALLFRRGNKSVFFSSFFSICLLQMYLQIPSLATLTIVTVLARRHLITSL
jgi:hypothetical protein